MKKIGIMFLFMILISGAGARDKSLIAKNAKIIKVSTGYSFTEGPAVAPDGEVYFTDQPNDRIYKWDEKSGTSLWIEGTRRSNGMYFNDAGRLDRKSVV